MVQAFRKHCKHVPASFGIADCLVRLSNLLTDYWPAPTKELFLFLFSWRYRFASLSLMVAILTKNAKKVQHYQDKW